MRPANQTEGEIVDSMEKLREHLGLRAVDVAKLLGFSNVRRYYELRETRSLPPDHSNDIRDRVLAITNLAARDLEGTRDLVRHHMDEVSGLLTQGRFRDLSGLLASVSRERMELRALSRPPQAALELEAAGQIEAVVVQPGFALAIDALAGLVPASQQAIPERLLAWVRLERNIRAAEEGEDVDAMWDFLPAMKRTDITELRARARACLREEAFTDDLWRSFIADEAHRAWAAYDPAMLPPDEDELPYQTTGPLVLSDWEPDWTAFDSPRRYSDRYGR